MDDTAAPEGHLALAEGPAATRAEWEKALDWSNSVAARRENVISRIRRGSAPLTIR